MAGSPSDAVGGQAVHVEEHHDTAYEALYFLFLSLTIGAAARGAVRNSRLPYTVALLFVGLAIGFLYSYADLGVLSNSLDIWVAIGPHTMLSVFLPALVFESAFSLEWHTFRKCAAQVLWLAGPGVLLGTFLMGALLKATLPYGWGWGSSLMLGSILSATDPVAVVALLKEVGASKRLGHIIEGESLVNDGTAIVVFSLLNEIAKGEQKTALEIFTFFVWVPIGAVLVGVSIAAGCHAWLGLGAVAGDHIVQISVTLFACYLCFLVAEFEASASGVLACVVLGVSIGAFGRGFFTGETEHSLHHFWEMLTFVANTVLFILTGVIIAKTTTEAATDRTLTAGDAGYGLLVYLECLFARAVVIAVLYPILRKCGYGLTPYDATVCWWGGLRGAVGLALALVVSEGEGSYSDDKVGPVTLLCTSIVVVGTLAVNGTTTGQLLQWLGLTRPEVSVQVAVSKARKHIRDQCLAIYHEHLTKFDDVMGTADFRAVAELVPFLQEEKNEDEEAAANAAAAAKAEKEGKPEPRKSSGTILDGIGKMVGSLAGPKRKSLEARQKKANAGVTPPGTPPESIAVVQPGGGMGMKRTKPKMTIGEDDDEEDTFIDLSSHLQQAFGGGLKKKNTGLMTPASSIANLQAYVEQAEKDEEAAKAVEDGLACARVPVKNAAGQFSPSAPDLAAAVTIAIKRDFEDAVAVWQRDVRGRFLAHLKVLYWEALEQGRGTKEIVEMLVECTDVALDNLDKPLGDWKALKDRMLNKAQRSSSIWKRTYRRLHSKVRKSIKWVRNNLLHSGAVGSGGFRRRALVAVALYHDAHTEARHAIFGVEQEGGIRDSNNLAALSTHAALRSQDSDVKDIMLEMDSDDFSDPASAAADRVRAESDADQNSAKAYLRAARTNEPELAAAVKSEETARRLLAVAERSAKGYVQSGLLTAVEAAELLSGISRAQRRLRLDPPEPVNRDPKDLMRMSPLLDPTHPAQVPITLARRMAANADNWVEVRYPGDAINSDKAVPGSLMLFARGVIDLTWARPIGDGGGGGGSVPLRIGASSTSYGWALGAADLLAPGAARFEMRAVSTVTAFYIPPEVVQAIFASSPGTAAAMWRAAFGLLSATLLRGDLLSVPPGVLKRAVTKARVTSYKAGDSIGPYNSRYNPDIYPVEELVVLMKGTLDCPTEGKLIGPCVVVPGSSSMLSGEQRDEFNRLAARVGMTATGDTVLTPEKKLSRDGDTWHHGGQGRRGGRTSQDIDARMRVEELVVVVKIALDPAKEIEKKSAWTAHNRLEQLAKLKVHDPSDSPRGNMRNFATRERPAPDRRSSIQVADIQRDHLKAMLRDGSDASASRRSGHRRVGTLLGEMEKANSTEDLALLDETGSPSAKMAARQGSFPPRGGNAQSNQDTFPPRGFNSNQDTFPPRGFHGNEDTFPPRTGSPPAHLLAQRSGSFREAHAQSEGSDLYASNLFGAGDGGRRGSMDVRPDPKSLAAISAARLAGQAFARGQGAYNTVRAGDSFKCGSGSRGIISQSSFYASNSPERTSSDGRSSGAPSRDNSNRGLRVNLLQRRISNPNAANEYTFPPRGGLASDDTFPPRRTPGSPREMDAGDAEMINIPEEDEVSGARLGGSFDSPRDGNRRDSM